MFRVFVSLLAAGLLSAAFAQQTPTPKLPSSGEVLDGVDFGDTPSVLYVPAKEIAKSFGLNAKVSRGRCVVNDKPLADPRSLYDGTVVVPIRDLKELGATVVWDEPTMTATVSLANKEAKIHRGAKRVVVNKREQRLKAWQGSLLVLETHVSTGRKGHVTPTGSFSAGSKERMHYSTLYDDSPMPWAVQVDGNVFIHGYHSVPRYPASHGCVRMPMRGRNPARWFYSWVDIGTPVTIANDWAS